jgi:hypothetical protein
LRYGRLCRYRPIGALNLRNVPAHVIGAWTFRLFLEEHLKLGKRLLLPVLLLVGAGRDVVHK